MASILVARSPSPGRLSEPCAPLQSVITPVEFVLQQVSERVKQVLCKAATDLTTHGPDNAIVEHAPHATEQVAV